MDSIKTIWGRDYIIEKLLMMEDMTDHEVFIYYYGHTKNMAISIYKNGWGEYKIPEVNFRYNANTTDEEFNKICEALEELIKC